MNALKCAAIGLGIAAVCAAGWFVGSIIVNRKYCEELYAEDP